MKNNLVQRVAQILIKAAMERRTVTYSDLALELGTPLTGNALGSALSPVLGDIFVWCRNNGLPRITALVVRKSGTDAGVPGPGFWALLGKNELPLATRKAMTCAYQEEVYERFTLG